MWRRTFPLAILGLAGSLHAADPTDDAVWRHFLQWLETAKPSPDVLSLLGAYRAASTQSGTPAAEAERRLLVIRRMMGQRNDAWPRMFDLIYASDTPSFRTLPTSLVVRAVEGRKPGRALDIAMGQGRNSVFLALKGWDAGGFDVSEKGLEVARRAAARAGVNIRTTLASHDRFPLEPAQWDLVLLTYAPVPFTDPTYAGGLIDSLRPNGLIVAESFAKSDSPSTRTPVDIDPDQLLNAFRALRLLHFQDVVDKPDWGEKPVRLIRFVAEKR